MASQKKIPFMVFPKSILNPPRKDIKLIDLPNEILVSIMGHMKVTDAASLALTCKHIARIATIHQALHVTLGTAPSVLEKGHFFRNLDRDWLPRYLRRCGFCGLFVSIQLDYWQRHSEKMKVKLGGRVARFWKEQSGNALIMVTSWGTGNSENCPNCRIIRIMSRYETTPQCSGAKI